MIADAHGKMGSLDILVNNAGIQFVSPIEDFPPEKWDAIIAINLTAAFHAIRAAVPGMKAQKWGRIINTASAHSLVASPFKSAYVSAKHGLAGLTKTAALELAAFGVTANCISPGYVWTPLVESQIPDTMKARNMTREQVINDVMLVAQPTKQFVTVDQVASLAVYLCSDAAAQITGANLSIDGGWTAAMSRAPKPSASKAAAARQAVKTVNLALQGGGSHGAYTWGVLDALAEDTRVEISAISGASAGTMNAVVFASGMSEGGRERAREKLEKFWLSVSSEGSLAPFERRWVDKALSAWGGMWPGSRWIDAWTEAVSGMLSPYEFNPFNINPLRVHLEQAVDFERLRASDDLKLFIAATNVRTGRGEIFRRDILTADHCMASACLPQLFQAVIIDGRALLGRRIRRQSAAVAPVLRDAMPRRDHRPDQSDRARRTSADAGRDQQSGRRGHLQREPFGGASRRRLRRPPDPHRRAQRRRIPGGTAPSHWRGRASSKPLAPRPRTTYPGLSSSSCATSDASTPRNGSRRISTRSASRARSTSIGRSSAIRQSRRPRARPRRRAFSLIPHCLARSTRRAGLRISAKARASVATQGFQTRRRFFLSVAHSGPRERTRREVCRTSH